MTKYGKEYLYDYKDKIKNHVIGLEGQEDKMRNMDEWTYSYRTLKVGVFINEQVDSGGKEILKFESAIKDFFTDVMIDFTELNFPGLTIDNKYQNTLTHLVNTILSKYQNRISLWSLLHFVDLMTSGEGPCNEDLKWFDPKAILRNLNKYLNHCHVKHDEVIEKVYQNSDKHMGAAERQLLMAKCINANPEHKAMFEKTMDKIQARVDREIYEEERGNRYLEDAKANFEKNIAEIFPGKYQEFIEEYDGRKEAV